MITNFCKTALSVVRFLLVVIYMSGLIESKRDYTADVAVSKFTDIGQALGMKCILVYSLIIPLLYR